KHVYNSTTTVLAGGKTKLTLDVPPQRVVTLASQLAEAYVDSRPNPPLKVDRWFVCEPRGTLGALLSDHEGWTSTIFAADGDGKFSPWQMGGSHRDRSDARYELQLQLSGLDRILTGIGDCLREVSQRYP
ncbi:MAG TPA: hypothetical protein VFU02_20215, partial [Polyangiaceae bacterium]|nr:hypothetical protein [Polyangiaceae bacterium]